MSTHTHHLLGWVYYQSAVDSKANLSRRCCGNSPVIRNNSNQSSASVIEPGISNDNLLFLLWFRGLWHEGLIMSLTRVQVLHSRLSKNLSPCTSRYPRSDFLIQPYLYLFQNTHCMNRWSRRHHIPQSQAGLCLCVEHSKTVHRSCQTRACTREHMQQMML